MRNWDMEWRRLSKNYKNDFFRMHIVLKDQVNIYETALFMLSSELTIWDKTIILLCWLFYLNLQFCYLFFNL